MPQAAAAINESLVVGTAQYRARHAEPEAGLAAGCRESFDVVLVVPACAESACFVDGYRAAASRGGRLLVVVVLNGRVGGPKSVHTANAACARALDAHFSLRPLGRNGWLGHDPELSLLLVDRFTVTRRLPARQGVGLARKIGADVALSLIAAGRVRHPFIAMTDADTRLPADYFERGRALSPGCSAALFPFWHGPSGNPRVDRATALYEIRLRYIQRGLEWARSPYAFHAMGSAMTVHALSYAQVRGVPKRQAAEDFYLLGKLSKVNPLAILTGHPVWIRSRVSHRVPFGTGAATATASRDLHLELYHPDCFEAVREVTGHLGALAQDPDGLRSAPLAGVSAPVAAYLESQDAIDTWRALARQTAEPQGRLRRFHEWFDSFRTLKLIHRIRDQGAPSLPWSDAIGRAPFMDPVEDDGACLHTARQRLLHREQTGPRFVGPSLFR